MRNILPILLIICLSCSNKSYKVYGTIIEIRYNTNEFLIHHDEIPGLMMAMTMPFSIQDSTDILRYSIGDSVHFFLTIDTDQALASDFQFLGKGTIPNLEDDWEEDQYTPQDIGSIFTDCTFLDTDSNNISLSSSDGKFRFISFIFTRCPMPNMCPAVITKNQYLARVFSEIPEIEFILLSFDYIYDTPSVMKSTYGSLLQNNSNLKIYSSFGHLNDIFSLAGESFVSFWGVDENDIGHTLRSVLLDPDRRLVKTYDGTDWQPESAERDIRNILKAYSL